MKTSSSVSLFSVALVRTLKKKLNKTVRSLPVFLESPFISEAVALPLVAQQLDFKHYDRG